jgi:hypothetical protein
MSFYGVNGWDAGRASPTATRANWKATARQQTVPLSAGDRISVTEDKQGRVSVMRATGHRVAQAEFKPV